MSRRERVTEEWAFSAPHRDSRESDTVTFKVSVKLGDKIYDNAEVTFLEEDLKRIVHRHEAYRGNWGGGFGE